MNLYRRLLYLAIAIYNRKFAQQLKIMKRMLNFNLASIDRHFFDSVHKMVTTSKVDSITAFFVCFPRIKLHSLVTLNIEFLAEIFKYENVNNTCELHTSISMSFSSLPESETISNFLSLGRAPIGLDGTPGFNPYFDGVLAEKK